MPKIKPFVDFTWWLNANTTNAVGDKDLIIAKMYFITQHDNYKQEEVIESLLIR